MEPTEPKKPMLLDCTFRDGGYVNQWKFTHKDVQGCWQALALAGFDYIEVGFRNAWSTYKNKTCGPWRFTAEADLCRARPPTPEAHGIKVAVMMDAKGADPDLLPDAKHSHVDLVRVAFHKPQVEVAMELCDKLKEKGYEVSANAMATINYKDDELRALAHAAMMCKVDYLYVADSYGCCQPKDIRWMHGKLRFWMGDVENAPKLGVHLHDNMGNAMANALEAARCGYDIIDSTFLGMGRGGGNLHSECMSLVRPDLKPVPLIYACHKFVSPYLPGYSHEKLLHTLGAIKQAHPNYVNRLCDYEITEVETVSKVLNKLRETSDHTYFDVKKLDSIIQSLSS